MPSGSVQITSIASPRVTSIRKLQQRRHRDDRGVFVVEGCASVEAALAHGHVRELWLTEAAVADQAELVELAQKHRSLLIVMSEAVNAAVGRTQSPPGIIAVVDQVGISLQALLLSGPRRLMILHEVNDPGNAGTIVRTADAAGYDGVIFTAGSVDPMNEKCVRATAGSIFTMPVCVGGELTDISDALSQAKISVLATDPLAQLELGSAQVRQLLSAPFAWLLGNEARGLEQSAMAAAAATVAIPMPGNTESLNLAVAAGLCIYADVWQV